MVLDVDTVDALDGCVGTDLYADGWPSGNDDGGAPARSGGGEVSSNGQIGQPVTVGVGVRVAGE